jgi:hypothetical protein
VLAGSDNTAADKTFADACERRRPKGNRREVKKGGWSR